VPVRRRRRHDNTADEVLAAHSEANLALTPGDVTLGVGAYGAGYAHGLNGIVDDLRLYNCARSAAEIIRDAKLGD